MRRLLPLLLCLGGVASAAPPPGLRYGGRAFTVIAPDLRMAGPYEDRFEWRSGIDYRVAYEFAPEARFSVGGRMRYQLRAGDRVEADVQLDLRDTWLQGVFGPLRLRGGLQRLPWGRNALLSPLDLLNPVDYTLGLTTGDPEEGRIHVLAAQGTFRLPKGELELVWIPFFQPMRVAWYGRDFAVLRPGLLEQALPDATPQTGLGIVDDALAGVAARLVDAIVHLDPYQRDGLQSALAADLPEELPWHGDFGARLGFADRGVALDAMVLWAILDQPMVTVHPGLRAPLLGRRLPTTAELTQLTNPGAELISTAYRRALHVGGDISLARDGFVVSLEGLFRDRTVRYTRDLEPFLSPAVQTALAVRTMRGTSFAVDVEVEYDAVLRPRDGMILVRPHNVQLAAGLQGAFPGAGLRLAFSAAFNPVQRDGYLHPFAQLELGHGLRVEVGAHIFGSLRPPPGDTLDAALAFEGGIPGWFAANDFAYAALTAAF